MSDQEPGTDSRDLRESSGGPEASGGYFAPLEWAKCMLLTTFERDGTAVSAPVRGVVDGDRAYIWAWSRSGCGRRLQRAGAVQVTPCSLRGFFTHGPPLAVTARQLAGEEATQAARKLARKHPLQHRLLIPLLHRTRRQQMTHFELLADDAGGQSGGHAEHESQELTRVHCIRTDVTDYGVAAIACIWPTSAHAGRSGETRVILAWKD
jgi:PPOX class probable F420-dependent enzyme